MNIEKIDIKYHRYGMFLNQKSEGRHIIKSLPWLSVVQAKEGRYGLRLDGGWNDIADGDFFIAPSQVMQDIMHHDSPATGTMTARWLFIDVIINERFGLDYLYDFPTVVSGEDASELNRLFDRLFETEELCERMSLYYQVIRVLLRVAVPKQILQNEALLKVTDYIAKNYRSEITIAGLASLIHMSESNFYSSFKKNFGKSPMAYINHYRLTTASVMLMQTHLSVSDIAEAVGYTDALYFSKQFRKTFMVSPREYRRGKI